MPPNRFCNAIYAWVVKRVEDKDRFDLDLNMPVPGRETEQDIQQEIDSFSAFMGTMKKR